ncbi:MAG TPA: acyltransferase [Bacteroidia bacterium]|nr:acyltransferase [Bacteroidia bacterium]
MQSTYIPEKKVYFRNLDSIRFFAALMVYLGHVIVPFYKYANLGHGYARAFLNVISDGGIGVSIFFVLSGFLITYIILTEIETTGYFSLKDFYIRRILRIWPLYFAVVIFAFLVYPYLKSLIGMSNNLCSRPGFYFTFLSNFDTIHIEKNCPGADAMMQNITWSVAIEEQFYAFWPFIFAFLPRKFFLPAILSVALASMAFRFYNYNDPIVLYFHTFSVLIDLAVGGLFAYMVLTSQRVRNFFKGTTYIHILAYFILLFTFLMWNNLYPQYKYSEAIERLVYAVLFAFIITSQSLISSPSRLELENIGIANKLGKYTYGIYLLHPIALTLVDIGYRLMHISRQSLAGLFIAGTLGFLLTIILSIISYEFYEKKFLQLKKKFSKVTTA